MKSTQFWHYILAGVLILASTTVFAENRGSLKISERVSVNGQSLPAGEYLVKWDGDGPNMDLRILRDSKLVTTIPAHTIVLPRKDPEDSVYTKKNDDGTWSLLEIHLGGKKYALGVGGEPSEMNSNGGNAK